MKCELDYFTEIESREELSELTEEFGKAEEEKTEEEKTEEEKTEEEKTEEKIEKEKTEEEGNEKSEKRDSNIESERSSSSSWDLTKATVFKVPMSHLTFHYSSSSSSNEPLSRTKELTVFFFFSLFVFFKEYTFFFSFFQVLVC